MFSGYSSRNTNVIKLISFPYTMSNLKKKRWRLEWKDADGITKHRDYLTYDYARRCFEECIQVYSSASLTEIREYSIMSTDDAFLCTAFYSGDLYDRFTCTRDELRVCLEDFMNGKNIESFTVSRNIPRHLKNKKREL